MNVNEAMSLLSDKLNTWAEQLVLKLPNIALAVVVLVLFWLAAKLVRKGVEKVMRRTVDSRALAGLATATVYLVVIAVGCFVALGIVGLDKTVTSLLAGAGIIGLALGFAFQDIAENFMAGILLSVRRPLAVGDVVESNGHFGTVDEITLRSTRLRTPQGQIVVIPNGDVFDNPIVNYSTRGERRIDLTCGVAYGDDLERARQVAIAAIEEIPERDQSREVEFFYNAFGGSSIDFVVRFWIDFAGQKDFLAAQSDAIVRLKQTFDEAGITIPFPITTLDFGVVGGEPLAEHWRRMERPAAS